MKKQEMLMARKKKKRGHLAQVERYNVRKFLFHFFVLFFTRPFVKLATNLWGFFTQLISVFLLREPQRSVKKLIMILLYCN